MILGRELKSFSHESKPVSREWVRLEREWMTMLQPLSDFVDRSTQVNDALPSYWYEGRCPQTGRLLKLPRTALVEAIAHRLMRHLGTQGDGCREGKMYGVLLVNTPPGPQVLKAFSGLLQGASQVPGWVPPIPGREQVAAAESQTLIQLEAMKQELIQLQTLPQRSHYASLTHQYQSKLQQLTAQHQQRKQERQQQRQRLTETLAASALAPALEILDEQSRQDGIQRRRLKRQWNQTLQPMQTAIAAADQQMHQLKQQRKQLSRQLQTQMHTHYWLTNFAGASLPLHQIMPGGTMPTGTGDCCAPKLLHYAASQGWEPLAMAEFWWGEPSAQGDKLPGQFYGACAERCQPLMGFLLSGLGSADTLPILYEDEWIIAVDKPAGLLSVPGRCRDRQDSVLTRLRLSSTRALIPVHRLDQDTSGILLLAKDPQTHRYLSQQFQQRQVHKVYEALLDGIVAADQGVIQLPLWSDPGDRPYQKVNWQQGKPSVTQFQVIAREAKRTRVEFTPITGRTHQIRVHAADSNGLGWAILGDRLYGKSLGNDLERLHLHARELRLHPPHSDQPIHLQVKTPF